MTLHFTWLVPVALALAAAAAALEVVDPQGRPVAEANVVLGWGGVATPFDRLTAPRLVAATDAHGRLPFAVPLRAGAVVVVDHPHFAPLRLAAEGGALPPRLVLEERPWQGRLATPPGAPGGRACARARLPMPGGEMAVERCTAIDEKGEFVLPALPPPVALTVSAPAFATQRWELAHLPTQPLALSPGVTVAGAVVDCSGQGVGGARLRWSGGEESTRADGSFLLGVGQLPVELTAEREDLVAGRWTLTTAEEAVGLTLRLACREGVEALLLAPGGPYRGEVSVASQRLDCPERCPSERRTLSTGEQGRLLVPLAGPGRYRLTLFPRQLAALTLSPLEVGAGQRLHLGPVVLDTGGGFAGRVVDAGTGEPLAGATVEVLPVGPEAYLAVRHGRRAAAVSGSDGSFQLGGVSLGRYLVRLEAEGRAALWRVENVPAPRLTDLGVLALGEGVPLAGQLEDRHGRPVAAAELWLRDAAGEFPDPLATTSSDTEGRFAFPALAPGAYRLEARRGPRLLLALGVEHPAGRELAVRTAGVKVTGVVQQEGVNQGGVTVSFSSLADAWEQRPILQVSTPEGVLRWGGSSWFAVTATATDGTFTLADVPPGPLQVSWRTSSGNVSRTLTVPDADTAQVALEGAGHTLTGRLLPPPADGQSVPLYLYDLANRPLARGSSDGEGRFALAGVPAGGAILEVQPAGGGSFRVAVQLPGEGPLLVSRPPERRPAAPLDVHFRRAGEAVTGVQAVLLPAGSVQPLAARLATGETLTFPAVPAGRYHLLWAEPLAGAGVTTVELPETGRSPLVVELPVGSDVLLICPAPGCAGAALAQLEVASPDGVAVTPLLSGWAPGVQLSAAGGLALGRLAPGRWEISAQVAGRHWQRTATMTPSQRAEIRLP